MKPSFQSFLRFIVLASTLTAISEAHPWLYSSCSVGLQVCENGEECSSTGQTNETSVQDCDVACEAAKDQCHLFVYNLESNLCAKFQTNIRYAELSTTSDSKFISGWKGCTDRSSFDAVWTEWVVEPCSGPCGQDGVIRSTRTCSHEGSNGGVMCEEDINVQEVICNSEPFPCQVSCLNGAFRWTNTGTGMPVVEYNSALFLEGPGHVGFFALNCNGNCDLVEAEAILYENSNSGLYSIVIDDLQGSRSITELSGTSVIRATLADTGSSRVVIGMFLNSETNIQMLFEFTRINADNVVSVDCLL